jgi:hypothetical protein
VQRGHAGGDFLDTDAELLRQVGLRFLLVRDELMQRRVEQANGGREAFERLEDADEILLLIGKNLGERRAAAGLILRVCPFVWPWLLTGTTAHAGLAAASGSIAMIVVIPRIPHA